MTVVPLSTSPTRWLSAAVEQHPLGDGGLAGVDVGDDADVADVRSRLRAMAPVDDAVIVELPAHEKRRAGNCQRARGVAD